MSTDNLFDDHNELPFPEMEALVLSKPGELFVKMCELDGTITKKSIEKFAREVGEPLVENGDGISNYAMLKAVEFYSGILAEMFKKKTIDELEKLHPNERKFRGLEFIVKNAPTTYKYDHDETMQQLLDEQKELNAKIKKRQELMLSAVDKDQVVVDGEIITPAIRAGGGGRMFQVNIPAVKKEK